MNDNFAWNDDSHAQLRALWDEGHSSAEIGRRMGVSKNAVVGKAHRLKFPARPSPIRRGDAPRAPYVRRASHETLPVLASMAAAPRHGPIVVRREPQVAPPPAVVIRPFAPVRECCWPIGEPGTREFRFCGERSVPARPYCSLHCSLAYVPVRDRRQDIWAESAA